MVLASIDYELWRGQAQNGVNLAFQVKFDLEGQGQSPPKTIGTLTKLFCTFCPNLVVLAWTRRDLWRGQARGWRTHTQTDTHTDRQTQATTIPEGQNWPRVKTSSLCWKGPQLVFHYCYKYYSSMRSQVCNEDVHPNHQYTFTIKCSLDFEITSSCWLWLASYQSFFMFLTPWNHTYQRSVDSADICIFPVNLVKLTLIPGKLFCREAQRSTSRSHTSDVNHTSILCQFDEARSNTSLQPSLQADNHQHLTGKFSVSFIAYAHTSGNT